MGTLNFAFELRDGYLLLKASGQVTLSEAVAAYKRGCDLLAEQGFDRLLVDTLAVEGELSTLERYELARTMAEYCKNRSINPKVAIVGEGPTVDGFGVRVASNQGIAVEMFSDPQLALAWLNAFAAKLGFGI